jgi:hypothetical protein
MYLLPSSLRHRSSALISVASLSDNQEAILPVVPSNIFGQNFVQKRGNALFDSGAQISLTVKIQLTVWDLKERVFQ